MSAKSAAKVVVRGVSDKTLAKRLRFSCGGLSDWEMEKLKCEAAYAQGHGPGHVGGRGGLFAGSTAIPMVSTSASVDVTEYCARVTVSQAFRHSGEHPLEVAYNFAAPTSTATVVAMEATVQGTHIVGRVKEREEAAEEYDDAVASGDYAYLLERQDDGSFFMMLGLLPGHEDAQIVVSYVTELGGDALRARLSVPLTKESAPLGSTVSVRVRTRNLVSVSSPTHTLDLAASEGGLEGKGTSKVDFPMFTLILHMGRHLVPYVLIENATDKPPAVLLSFTPDLANVAMNSEIVFVIDRSGSMRNVMKATLHAMMACLTNLPDEVTFNIYGFGSSYDSLFPLQSLPATAENKQIAREHLRAMKADLGGTDLLPVLDAIYARPVHPGWARQVFILTDGAVANRDQCLTAVQRRANETRVFSFGIGTRCDRALVEGLAHMGNGKCEFLSIDSSLAIREKVVLQLLRATKSSMTDVEIDWGDLQVQVMGLLPPVYHEEPYLVYALVSGDIVPSSVVLSARAGSSRVSFSLTIDPATTTTTVGSTLHCLAAARHIRQLELVAGTCASSRARILELALAHNLASSQTSFVCTLQRDDAPSSPPEVALLREDRPLLPSAAFAQFTSTVKEERERGVTISVTTEEFFTPQWHYTISNELDDIKRTVSSPPATAAILSLPSAPTALDAWEEDHGLLAELRLLRAWGVGCLIVVVEMEIAAHSASELEKRFGQCREIAAAGLEQTGWPAHVPILPISSQNDINITSLSAQFSWWHGSTTRAPDGGNLTVHTLVDTLDQAVAPRKLDCEGPLRVAISGVYKIKGVGDVVAGYVRQGSVSAGQAVSFLRGDVAGAVCHGTVRSVEMGHCRVETAVAGDDVGVCMEKGMDRHNLPQCGDVMVDGCESCSIPPIPQAAEFTADVVAVVDCDVGKLCAVRNLSGATEGSVASVAGKTGRLLERGERVCVHVELSANVFVEAGERIVICDNDGRRVCCVGTIV